MRQLAAESSFKLVIRRVVPCFERCNPSINKRSSFTSPFLHRKLSWLHIKTHPFSSAIRLISSFIETPFTAAASLSVRGVMLLRLTWPVAETRFASSAIARRFEVIFSSGNFVAQSFVPTWTKMSADKSDFILRRACKMSPVLAPPRAMTFRDAGSVHATSRMVESPISRFDRRDWDSTWVHWEAGFDTSVSILVIKEAFSDFKSFTAATKAVFEDKSCCRLPRISVTIDVRTAMEVGIIYHVGHTHQETPLSAKLPSSMQSSWYHTKQKQQRIISPVSDRMCLHRSMQWWPWVATSWRPSCWASVADALAPPGGVATSGSRGGADGSTGDVSDADEFLEDIRVIRFSCSRVVTRFLSHALQSISSHWRISTDGDSFLQVMHTGMIRLSRS